jgi:hypothetical protein
MLMQKMVLAPRLAPILAAACELEYNILLLIDAHPQAKKSAAEYRAKMAAKKQHPRLSTLLSILMSSCGLRSPHQVRYLRSCVTLRNLLVHGAYREAVQALSDLPQLQIKNNVVSFLAARGFPVPMFSTRLEEVMMFVNEPRLGATIATVFDGAHLLLHLGANAYYERKNKIDGPLMTVGNYPGDE